MTRDDLLELLSRLHDEGFLTIEQAAEILRAFERGGLTPQQAAAAAPLDPMFRYSAVAFELQRAAWMRTRTVAGVPLERIIVGRRNTVTIRMVEDFDDLAAGLARRLAAGDMGTAAWQAEMRDTVARQMMQQAQLGRGRTLLPSELERLREAIDAQADYLQRFADEVAARKLRAETIGDVEPYSEAYVRERGRMYAGEARAQYYEGIERRDPGWVFLWVAMDDGGTCSVCAEASGQYYLAGEGPMPGRDCLARGKCRCRREEVWSPEVYARLTGQPVEATA
jgi:hypothetical protein